MDKKFYITTTIPYANAPPHIGFALEIVLADVLARYHKQKGEEVFFLILRMALRRSSGATNAAAKEPIAPALQTAVTSSMGVNPPAIGA